MADLTKETESVSPKPTEFDNPFSSSSTQLPVLSHPSSDNLRDGLFIFKGIQFPEKFTGSNYISWRDQALDALFGLGLTNFIDKKNLPLPTSDATAYLKWCQHDRLLRHAMVASLNPEIKPFIHASRTSAEVWETLDRIYGSGSASRLYNLKGRFRHVRQVSQSVS